MILDQLPHADIVLPPVPDNRQQSAIFILKQPHSLQIFLHELLIFPAHSLNHLVCFLRSVALPQHELPKEVDLSLGVPVLSSDGARVVEVLGEGELVVLVPPPVEGVTHSPGLALPEKELKSAHNLVFVLRFVLE